jgi:hypothetical protein
MVTVLATPSQTRLLKLATLFALFGMGIAIPATGQGPALAMLDRLESGRWELRERGGGAAAEQLCVQNGRRLIQLRHPASTCERMIVSDGPSEVTVQYTCRGRGYGRTHIRRETGRLVQIESQGILDGLPFDVSAEGRRVGDCAGG